MNITLTGKNFELTDALSNFTKDKMERLVKRHTNVKDIHVTFTVENITHTAEANAKLDDTEIHASAKADDMYIAVDMLIDKLIVQITKHKDKVGDHR